MSYQGFAPENDSRPNTGDVPTFQRGSAAEKDSVRWGPAGPGAHADYSNVTVPIVDDSTPVDLLTVPTIDGKETIATGGIFIQAQDPADNPTGTIELVGPAGPVFGVPYGPPPGPTGAYFSSSQGSTGLSGDWKLRVSVDNGTGPINVLASTLVVTPKT